MNFKLYFIVALCTQGYSHLLIDFRSIAKSYPPKGFRSFLYLARVVERRSRRQWLSLLANQRSSNPLPNFAIITERLNGNPFPFPFSMHDNRLEDIVYQQSALRGGRKKKACQTEESSSQEGPSSAKVVPISSYSIAAKRLAALRGGQVPEGGGSIR